MDKLSKIRRHLWKEHLKINKIAKFESDLLKTKTLKYSGWQGGGRKGIYLRPHGCSPGKFTLIIDPPGRESAERS